jgi:hypothetical protein
LLQVSRPFDGPIIQIGGFANQPLTIKRRAIDARHGLLDGGSSAAPIRPKGSKKN